VVSNETKTLDARAVSPVMGYVRRKRTMSEMEKGRLKKGARGSEVTFELDGKPHVAYEGETVAAAMLAAGIRSFRLSPKLHQPRSVFCGMGVCFDCLVTINGVANCRACMTNVETGMKVETGLSTEKGCGNEKG
jgi:sarcosine oxidase subunit alpha